MKFRIGMNNKAYIKTTLPTKIKNTVFELDTGGPVVLRLRGEDVPLAVAKKGFGSSAFRIFRPMTPFFAGQKPTGSHQNAPLFHYATFTTKGLVIPAPGCESLLKPFAVLNGLPNSFEKVLVPAEGHSGKFKYNSKSKLHEIEVTEAGYDAALIICLTHLVDLVDVDVQMSQVGKSAVMAGAVAMAAVPLPVG